MTGLDDSNTSYKSLRPSQILKSGQNVKKVVEILESEYVNPFAIDIDKEKLFNLNSGVAVNNEFTDGILGTFKIGKSLAEIFTDERLIMKNIPFHTTLKKNKFVAFSKTSCQIKIAKKDGKTKIAEVNRNILGTLNSYSLKTGRPVDFSKALQYPLTPIPLSICNADQTENSHSKRSYI